MPDENEKSPVVVPLLQSPGVAPPPKQKGIWYMIRGTTVGGVFLVALGSFGFYSYIRSDKEHQLETVVLYVSVGFIAAGFHFISRQSVRNFLSDVGSYIPGRKGKPDDPPGDGP